MNICTPPMAANSTQNPWWRLAGRVTPIEGVDELRRRIASALEVPPGDVEIERYHYAPSGLTLRCVGREGGRRFFAKVFLCDPYPIAPRFQAIWDQDQTATRQFRPIFEQIDTEYEMTRKMRETTKSRCVPVVLGKSHSARTLAWEEAKGERLDVVALRSRWAAARARSSAAGMLQAGRWLRTLHDTTCQGEATVEFRSAAAALEEMRLHVDGQTSGYIETARAILDAAFVQAGAASLTVPRALTHGDFCLANLIWDDQEARLAVVDFELSGLRPISYDLVSLIYDLRRQLLNPLVPDGVISSWENSFWKGYGGLPGGKVGLINALALARIFYQYLPKLLTRGERHGWMAGINAHLYRYLLEGPLLSTRLGVSRRRLSSGQ